MFSFSVIRTKRLTRRKQKFPLQELRYTKDLEKYVMYEWPFKEAKTLEEM